MVYGKNSKYSVMTLSPLTPMATHFHIRNGAKLIQMNPTTQNFEYKVWILERLGDLVIEFMLRICGKASCDLKRLFNWWLKRKK